MERPPHRKYTKELRLEAVRLVTEGGLSVLIRRIFMAKPLDPNELVSFSEPTPVLALPTNQSSAENETLKDFKMRNRMESVKMKSLILILYGLLLFLSIVSCQQPPNLTGKWQETNERGIFEFREDHTFSTVDNMGMQVSGKYNLDGHGNIRFEIPHEESNIEIIDAKVTVAGDELIFKFDDTNEIERYRRVGR